VTYFQAKAAAEANETAIRLYQLLYDFKTKCGVKRVNLIGHSMGARVLASFFDKFNQMYINDDGKAVMRPSEPSPTSPSSSITISMDTKFDIEKGKTAIHDVLTVVARGSVRNELLPTFGACLFVNGEADLTTFQSAYKKCMHELAESITVFVDTTDFALLSAQYFNYLQCWQQNEPLALCLGRCLTQIYDNYENNDQGALLDIDTINAGLIDGSNVDKNRHCYFHLSRQVIEDIRELIVSRKRAKDRTGRLVNNEGNLYDFLIAPPYVKA
jgi:hypothetical protein